MSEALFVGGYAALLLVLGIAFEWAARVSHDRIHQTKTIGFRYHGALDAWQCSEGTFLWRHEADAAARVITYRAKAEICNACSLKPVCTDSSEGRSLVRPMDSWPHSDLARFQRTISLSVMMLAALFCLIEVGRQSEGWVQVAFASGAILAATMAVREWRRVREVRTPLFR